nr:hypothetical protein [uncultured Enterobacter sp.]
MHHHIAIIDIIYNPSCYCDDSWLDNIAAHSDSVDALPGYVKNRLLLSTLSMPDHTMINTDAGELQVLLIENWPLIRNAAWLMGLKLLSARLMQDPGRVKTLTKAQWDYVCLPLFQAIPAANNETETLTDQAITAAGAGVIYTLASTSLCQPLLERLSLLFPYTQRFDATPTITSRSALAALKWAFHYA